MPIAKYTSFAPNVPHDIFFCVLKNMLFLQKNMFSIEKPLLISLLKFSACPYCANLKSLNGFLRDWSPLRDKSIAPRTCPVVSCIPF